MLELVSLYVPVALVGLYWLVAVRRPLLVLCSSPKPPTRRR